MDTEAPPVYVQLQQVSSADGRSARRYVGESAGSLAMAVAFSDNAYFTPHYKAVGRPFTADVAPNAAARAPGVVQSILAHEVVMEHVARSLGLPMDVVQVSEGVAYFDNVFQNVN
jgi:xanthine dehydrogenase molybdopterin-binding subunit B